MPTHGGILSLYSLPFWDGESRRRNSALPEQLKLVLALLQILCEFLCYFLLFTDAVENNKSEVVTRKRPSAAYFGFETERMYCMGNIDNLFHALLTRRT